MTAWQLRQFKSASDFKGMIAPRFWLFVLILCISLLPTFSAQNAFACGDDTDCTVSSGSYRIYLPDNIPSGKKIPAIIHVHGLWRSGEQTVNRSDFQRMAKRLGIALIGADGIKKSWTFENGVQRGKPRDEFKYFRDVAADVSKRFNVDRSRIVMSGFSIGASMVWNLACRDRTSYAGFLPVAGTLWRPQPTRCNSPVGNIYHVHGTNDPTFPISGRRVQGKHQGDIRVTFENMRRQDSCTDKVVEEKKIRNLRCKLYRNCAGEPLRFCLHNGDHHVKAFYLEDGFREIARSKGWRLPS